MSKETITMKLHGAKEIESAIDSLSVKMAANILRQANSKIALKNVKPEIKNNLPFSKKTTRAIVVRKDKSDKTAILVGATRKAFWLRFLEKGTKLRRTRGRMVDRKRAGAGKVGAGISRGIMGNVAPRIERAVERSLPFTVNALNEEYGKIVHEVLGKEVEKGNRKIQKQLR